MLAAHDPFFGAVADPRSVARRLVGVLLGRADRVLAAGRHLGPSGTDQLALLQGTGEAQQVGGAGERTARRVPPVGALGDQRSEVLVLAVGLTGTVVVGDARVGQPLLSAEEARPRHAGRGEDMLWNVLPEVLTGRPGDDRTSQDV